MKKNITYILLLLPLFTMAQIPTNYYDAAEGRKDNSLRSALYNIIKGHKVVSYDNLYNVYATSDTMHLNGTVYVWDMYSANANKTAKYYFIPGQKKMRILQR